MASIERFEDLQVWQLARVVTRKVYAVASTRPFASDFGLKDQMCRAAVSILSNIAEGFERGTDKSFQSFLAIANGSAGELRAQLYVAFDLRYISQEQFDDLKSDVIRIGKMIVGLIQYLRNGSAPPPPRPSDPKTLRPPTLRPSDPKTLRPPTLKTLRPLRPSDP